METTTSKKKSPGKVPEGFHTVTPYLIVNDASKLIEFLKNAFNAEQTFILRGENNSVTHATVKIGDSTIMLADAMDGMPQQTAMLYIYVDDADAAHKKAVQAKGISIHEPTTEFYGDRAGAVKDEWGNMWWVATQVEQVEEAELKRRADKVMKERKEKKMEHA